MIAQIRVHCIVMELYLSLYIVLLVRYGALR